MRRKLSAEEERAFGIVNEAPAFREAWQVFDGLEAANTLAMRAADHYGTTSGNRRALLELNEQLFLFELCRMHVRRELGLGETEHHEIFWR